MGVIINVRQLSSALAKSEHRAVASNFAWLVADKLVRFMIGAGVGFYVARYLGPQGVGSLGYAAAIAGMVMLMAEGGLEAIVRRELVVAPVQAPRTLAAALMWRLLVGVVGYGLVLVLCLLPFAAADENRLLPIFGLMVFQPSVMVPELWFHARMQSRVTVFAQWGAALAGAGLRVVLVNSRAELIVFAWVAIIEVAFCAALLAWCARQAGLGLNFGGKVVGAAWRMAREAWPLMLSGIAVAIYMRIDAVMLRNMAGEEAVGIYMAGVKFSEMWLFAPAALAASMIPRLTQAKLVGGAVYAQKLWRYCQISALLGYGLAGAVFLVGPWLVRLAYGEAFAAAAPVQMVHAWVLLFASLGVARGQVCVLEGWTRFHLIATLIGAVVNIGLNWVLIPSHGPVGAAVATLAAQVVAAWLSTYLFKPAVKLAWMHTRALLCPLPSILHET
jgi:O-antigen/teichoic acid export membrane protein